jgi:hypothetical protein
MQGVETSEHRIGLKFHRNSRTIAIISHTFCVVLLPSPFSSLVQILKFVHI